MQFDVYWADLNSVVGREQAGHRPVLVVSNDIENQMDNVTIVPVTSRKPGRRIYPNEVGFNLMEKEAIVLCHQIRTISKRRLSKKIETLSDRVLRDRILQTICRRVTPV